MKQTSLFLVLLCISLRVLPLSTQPVHEKDSEIRELKKGDWFMIEFANRLEDYSPPVDSVDYCAPMDLKQLVLMCEVLEADNKNLKLVFEFERILDMRSDGLYFDSYFDEDREDKTIVYFDEDRKYEPISFQIGANIDLKNDSVEFTLSNNDLEEFEYEISDRGLDVGYKSITGRHYIISELNSIALAQVQHLIMAYLDNWSKQRYQTPLLSFGELNIGSYRKYRILDSNLHIKDNIYILVNGRRNQTGDIMEIFETNYIPNSRSKEIKLFTYELDANESMKSFYLPKQKFLKLKVDLNEFKFIANPGDTIRINLNTRGDISGGVRTAYSGELEYYSEIKNSKNYFTNYPKELRKINSIDSVITYLNKETAIKIGTLNSFKQEMSANWYRKQLKEIYYRAAELIIFWHNARDIEPDYSKIRGMSAFRRIQPLYDYVILPENYHDYLNMTIRSYSVIPPLESVPSRQGLMKRTGAIENYDVYDALYLGYPKYLKLKQILQRTLIHYGIKSVQANYDRFILKCKYRPFVDEIKELYQEVEKISSGEDLDNLDLNFIKDELFANDKKSFKIVQFLPTYRHIDEIHLLVKNISHNVKGLNLNADIGLYFVYSNEFTEHTSIDSFPRSSLFENRFIYIESSQNIQEDLDALMMNNSRLLILSPDNKIVSRNTWGFNIDSAINRYIESQNQSKSLKGRTALILGALTSFLFSFLLAWAAIRIRGRQIKKREAARRKLSELELRAIRSQMNPHFIFNAMGSIQNLINQNNTKNANLYLSRFANLMRMVLANSNKKLVSLANELELLQNYLELEQLRVDFKYKIELGANVDPEIEEIPGMLIQPFVENAVIHGITPNGKGNIWVEFSREADTLFCRITDDGVGINTSGEGNGNGLAMKLSAKRLDLLNSQLQTRMRLQVENRQKKEHVDGTIITLLIPVG